jgi:hypothetical protein
VDDWVRLGPRETAAGRRFTDPAQTDRDLRAVRVMLAEIRRQVARAAALPASDRVCRGDPGGHSAGHSVMRRRRTA